MTRTVQNGIVGVIGVIVVTAVANGLYLNFVKSALRIPLLVAGILLVLVAVHGTYAAEWRRRPGRHAEGEDDGVDHTDTDTDVTEVTDVTDGPPDDHGHHHPRIGWLLLVPFLVLGVAAPPPLGSYSARSGDELVSTVQSAEGLGTLAAGEQLDLSLSEYSARALYEPPEELEGRTIRLVGFVTPAGTPEGWVLARMALNCCAADAFAVRVEPRGGERLPDDTWVRVEGTFVATPERVSATRAPGLPVLQVSSVEAIDQPAQPYDD